VSLFLIIRHDDQDLATVEQRASAHCLW
jgi:hypothetical protein